MASSSFRQSTACCSIPPIDPNEVSYEPKGRFEDIAGLKTYIVGDDSSNPPKHALIVLYDIFAFHPNTLRGADILASSSTRPYLVLMPDFFEGQVANWEWYPDDTPEKTERLESFLNGPGNTKKTVEKVVRVQNEASEKWKGVEKWGVLGYCWGGWVVSYCSGRGTPFSAVAELHPGFVGKEIAEQITIPLLAICSKDEPEEDAKRFMNNLNPSLPYKNYIIFPTMEHGWLSARGDFNNEEVRRAYGKGYELMLEFFGKWM